MEKKFRPILLAGGSGKRLWPLSTKEKPKQFIELFGDLSLFDLTLQRINNKKLFLEPLIVTSKNYLPLNFCRSTPSLSAIPICTTS